MTFEREGFNFVIKDTHMSNKLIELPADKPEVIKMYKTYKNLEHSSRQTSDAYLQGIVDGACYKKE